MFTRSPIIIPIQRHFMFRDWFNNLWSARGGSGSGSAAKLFIFFRFLEVTITYSTTQCSSNMEVLSWNNEKELHMHHNTHLAQKILGKWCAGCSLSFRALTWDLTEEFNKAAFEFYQYFHLYLDISLWRDLEISRLFLSKANSSWWSIHIYGTKYQWSNFRVER